MNICKSQFGTRVFCSNPSSESNNISQLLSCHENSENGYLAASFVTPPVYILVSWLYSYNVNRIIFKPSLDGHVINKLSVCCIPKKYLKDDINNKNFMNIINQFKLTKPDVFLDLSTTNDSQIVEINFLSEYGRSDTSLHIYNLIRSNIGAVLFKIISMRDTSLPCLSGLKIYSPIERRNEIQLPCKSVVSPKKLYEKITEEDNLEMEDNYTYPDELIDPLTAELLINPVKLPCGKYVNLETLLKCWSSQSESASKCNPFTRVPLTKSQMQSITVIDLEKKEEISMKVREFQKRKRDFYNNIMYPKKKYVKLVKLESDSDSDEERSLQKLKDNISQNFPFLIDNNL